jgi:ribosomal protein S18 acetylase RimI-like enzyme
MNIEIIDYTPEYRDAIRILSEAWLKKYFYVEPCDAELLGDPEGQILDKGGFIYYAREEAGSIIGVAALIYVEDGEYELSKMGVDEAFQGQGIGRRLAEKCLEKAREICARKVILYSNTCLEPAIQLYRNLGFRAVELKEQHYDRANIKMELNLLEERHHSLGFLNTRFWY